MPGMDGLETTRHLRDGSAGEAARHVAVIGFTAHACNEDRLACLRAGMDDVLIKPRQHVACCASLCSVNWPPTDDRACCVASRRGGESRGCTEGNHLSKSRPCPTDFDKAPSYILLTGRSIPPSLPPPKSCGLFKRRCNLHQPLFFCVSRSRKGLCHRMAAPTHQKRRTGRASKRRKCHLRIKVLLPNRDSIRSTATSAVALRTSNAGLNSITSSEPRRSVSAIISMHSCASR